MYGQCVTYICDLGYAINPRDVSSTTFSAVVRLSLAVPCNKPEFENVERSTVSVRCHEEILNGFLSTLESSTVARQDSQPLARFLVHPQNVSMKRVALVSKSFAP